MRGWPAWVAGLGLIVAVAGGVAADAAAAGDAAGDSAGVAPPPQALPALGLAGPLPQASDLLRPFDTPLPVLVKAPTGLQRVEAVHCQDWLARRAQAVGSDNDAAWRVVRFQTVPCEAMALLKSVQPAAPSTVKSALPASFADALATQDYPAALWPAVSPQEQRRLAAPGLSLERSSGVARWVPVKDSKDAHGSQNPSLVLSRQGWRVQMQLLARGDFDGDGWEDAAFAWQAQALKGSYADSRLVLLTRRAGDKAFGLIDAGPLLDALARAPAK